MSSCPRGWGHDANQTVKITRLALETCFWPLFEVEDGRWSLNYVPEERLSIEMWLRPQKRFAHLFEPQEKTELLREIQKQVDRDWERLLQRCEVSACASV